jgi:Uma2 family endonuclease
MSVAMEDWPRRHRISVEEYHRMGEVGLLAPDARVELIDGDIIDMPPIGLRHAAIVIRLDRLLQRAVGDRAIVACQSPIQLGDFSEPQPDFALLAPREDFYEHKRPTAADVLLAIEVSESTLKYDRETKRTLYAGYGVPEFWMFDLVGRRLHFFSKPSGTTYTESFSLDRPGTRSIALLPDVTLDLSSVFG